MKTVVVAIVLTVLLSALLVGGLQLVTIRESENAMREGREAFMAGATDTANPYQGARGATNASSAWLRGWLYQKSVKEFRAPR